MKSFAWWVVIATAIAPVARVEAAAARFPQARSSAPSATAALQLSVSRFYEARASRPLWFGRKAGDAADQLVRLIGTVEADGLSRADFQAGSLITSQRAAQNGDAAAVHKAEMIFSIAFVKYAQALQRDPRVGVIYVDDELRPKPSSADSLLDAAGRASSLADYVGKLGWMNPIYGQLRRAIVRKNFADRREHELLRLNLERARALPPLPDRYVLVNTANQRLYMYEDGKIVDQMKVVVGRPDAQTPLMNAYIRHAVLNPYWNVPADIASRLAANVVKRGSGYLTEKGYQLVSSPEGPPIRKTEKIVWKSLANGDIKVHLRQLPGPANPMGRVKFMFPNSQGIWLHDTPGRHLLNEEMRLESNGCVRLEDAWRVAAWLFRAPLSRSEKRVEHRVEMPEPVPVYITYLTAIAREGFIEYLPDVYQRDIPAFVEHPSAPAAEARVGGS